MTAAPFEAGDRVVVPWGLDEIDGVVERVVTRGGKASVDVLVSLPGEEEPESVNFPLSIVALSGSQDDGRLRGPGVWLDALHYEAELTATVRSMLEELSVHVESEGGGDADRRADLEITLANGQTLLVEAKRVEHVTASTVERAVEQLRSFIGRSAEPGRALGLIVFGANVGSGLEHWSRSPDSLAARIGVTTWRGHEDDERLRSVLGELAA